MPERYDFAIVVNLAIEPGPGDAGGTAMRLNDNVKYCELWAAYGQTRPNADKARKSCHLPGDTPPRITENPGSMAKLTTQPKT